MGNIFFIGDTHFSDKNIINFEKRPFKNLLEQTERLTENWNKVVSENDIVYIVGDFVDNSIGTDHLKYIRKLNGTKYLIRGNHDNHDDEFYLNECDIKKVYDHPIILENFWIVSHEPMYVNSNYPYANIFAHVHNNPIYKTSSERHYCVSSERTAFTPISFDYIKSVVYNYSNRKF